jgi:MoxR-like ATPase
MIVRMEASNPLSTLRPVSYIEEILEAQDEVRKVYIDGSLKRYIVALADATRHNGSIMLGASPRAVLNAVSAAKAHACFMDRNYVIPDDIQKILPYVWSHRLILTQDSKMKGHKAEKILGSLLQDVKVPVLD